MPEKQQIFPSLGHHYDVIVVGAGLAGSECAWRCARSGLDVLLVTSSLDTVGNFFADAVELTPPQDSLMATLCETTLAPQGQAGTIQNWHYHRAVKYALEHQTGIHFLQSSVTNLLSSEGRVTGISTWEGVNRYSSHIALCVGTFLQPRLYLGRLEEKAGRLSEMAYDDLYQGLLAQGFQFTKQQFQLEAHEPVYRVEYQQFAASEWHAATFSLKRLAGLYAAGACVAKGDEGQAALQGMQLAQTIVTAQLRLERA